MKMHQQLFELTKDYHNIMSAYVIDIGTRDVSTSNVRLFIEQDYKALLIEPNPNQIVHIEKEMFNEYKEYLHNIKLIPVAIGEKEQEIEFIISPEAGHCRIPNGNFDRNKWRTLGEKKVKVMMYDFQTILNSYPEFEDCSIMDIDTEGYDTVVLKSVFNSECRPMFIMIEDWDDPVIIIEQAKLFNDNRYELFSNKINQSKIWKTRYEKKIE